MLLLCLGCDSRQEPIDNSVPASPLAIQLGQHGEELSFSTPNVVAGPGNTVEWDTQEAAGFQISVPYSETPPPVVTVEIIALDATGKEVSLGSAGGQPQVENSRLLFGKKIRVSQPRPDWSPGFRIRVTATDNEGSKGLLEAPLPVKFVSRHHGE